MLIPFPDMLYSGTLKHQMILITNFKATLSMALWTKPLETWEALAAPNIRLPHLNRRNAFTAEAETRI